MPSGKPEDVEACFRQILSLSIPADLRNRALFEFATYLDDKNVNPTKAAAVYEKLLLIDPTSPQAPLINFRLAHIYRKLGADHRSLNKLYEVLSSAIRAGREPKGEDLTRQAMLEIGNAHFESGQYDESARIYSRIKLLDLPPKEQAFVLFRATELLFRKNQYDAAIEAGRQFLTQYPTSEFVPACQQMIVQSLEAGGHQDEAIQETLALLRSTQAGSNPSLAIFWKMKTGNDLANVLYSRGEFLRALQMYQAVAELNRDPAWRLPAIYQIGLCFERLKEPLRAVESFRYVASAKFPGSGKEPAKVAAKPSAKVPSNEEADPPKDPATALKISLNHLQELAAWRVNHLEWMVGVGTKLYPILSAKAHAPRPSPSPEK